MGLNACHLRPDQNRFATATVTVTNGTAATGYLPANAVNGDPSNPVIASAAGAFGLQFDLGSALAVDAVFLPMHNIPAGTNVRVRGNSAASWGAAPLDQPLVIAAYSPTGIPESVWVDLRGIASRTYRYWQLYVPAFASAARIGDVLGGPMIEWPRNYKYGWREQQSMPSVVKRTALGSQWALSWAMRQRQAEFEVMPNDAQVALFKGLEDAAHGSAKPFMLVPNPTVNQALLVTLDAPLVYERTLPNLQGSGINTVASFAVTEVQRGLP